MAFTSIPGLNEHIAVKAMFNYFGRKYEPPLSLNEEMLKWGEAHSPEYACFPFKQYLGFLKQMADKGHTDVFAHGMCDIRSCRYVDLLEGTAQIIRENGHPDFKVHFWGGHGLDESFKQLGRIMGGQGKRRLMIGITVFCLTLEAADEINDLANQARPREAKAGDTDKWLKKWNLKLAAGKNVLDPLLIAIKARSEYKKIRLDTGKRPLHLALAGDMFKIHEPFSHFDTIRKLNALGASVKQPLPFSLIFFGMNRVPFKGSYYERYNRLITRAKKYLQSAPASYLDISIGELIEELENGAQGIVHFQSFGCMPDLLLKPILDRLADDYGVPIIHFLRDTHSSDTQYQTRLEAFVDLIKRKQKL